MRRPWGDGRHLERAAKLLRWLIRALIGLPLQAFADEPGGGALRVIVVLVVAPLLRHRAARVHVQKCAGRTLPVLTPHGRGFS